MPSQFIPKKGTMVAVIGDTGTFKVLEVNDIGSTADIQIFDGSKPVRRGVPWSSLAPDFIRPDTASHS
jgi:hypothetical protein